MARQQTLHIRMAVALTAAVLVVLAWRPALALDMSLGPSVTSDRIGPNGARVFPVKRNPDDPADPTRLYTLDGYIFPAPVGGGMPVLIGQSEPGEARTTHQMLFTPPDPARVFRRHGGAVDDHATGVASIMVGTRFNIPSGTGTLTLEGVAPGANLYSAAGDYIDRTDWLLDQSITVLNMSAGFGALPPDGQSWETLVADAVVYGTGITWVTSAGNAGLGTGLITSPADAHNVITVGATGDALGLDFTQVAGYSSRGPTADGRSKVDLVAPGTRIDMAASASDTDHQNNSGTSFAAPHVAGMAALLYEHGNENGYPHSHLAIKAALLNSASKHVSDQSGVAWPDSPAASYTWVEHWGGALRSTQPLDYAMGAGQLNGLAAVRQMQGEGRSDIGLRYINPMAAGNTAVYSLANGATLKRGSLVEATVVWDRQVVQQEGTDGEDPAHYTVTPLPDIDLRLYRVEPMGDRDLVAYSASSVDNVEHIYFNIHDDGRYELEVIHYEGARVEQAAVGWTAGSSEGLAFSVDGGAFDNSRRASGTQNPAEGRSVDVSFPNDVNSLGTLGPGHFPTEGEVFTSDESGTNQQRFSGAIGTRSRVGPHNAPPAGIDLAGPAGVFGLKARDNVVGLSWGTDGTALSPTVLAFSVDPDAEGVPGVPLYAQAVAEEAAGDIYLSSDYRPFGAYLSPFAAPQEPHRLRTDEAALGLAAKGRDHREDDLDALELTPPVDGDPYGPAVDPDGDGMPNIPVFITLDEYSPSASGTGGMTPDDIFVVDPRDPSAEFDLMPGGSFVNSIRIFADGATMGLGPGDRVNSLALSDVTPAPTAENPYRYINRGNAQLDQGFDQALFTLSNSPGAICFTDFLGGHTVFATNASLGLAPNDKVNALDVLHSWIVVPPWVPPTIGPPPPITPKTWRRTEDDPTYTILTPSALLPSGAVITEEVMVEPWAAYGPINEEVQVRVEGWVTGDATVEANVGAVDFIFVPTAETPVMPNAVKVPGMFWVADPSTFDLGQVVTLENGSLADLTFTPMGTSFELRVCYELPSLSEDEPLLHLLNIIGEINPVLDLVFQNVEFDLGPEAYVPFEMTLFPDFYGPKGAEAVAMAQSIDTETLLFTLKFSGLAVAPEPATLALLALGGLGVLLRRKGG
ncbi:MAG TPA: S8 family serine peptidase [Phycisphaerae bacterium]|nr:S8 family serine peptidase [Phycisphaerae bacterium]